MSDFETTLTINICIGVVFVFGLCWFMFKRTNWFKEGGIAYEYFKARKEAKKAEKVNNKEDNK